MPKAIPSPFSAQPNDARHEQYSANDADALRPRNPVTVGRHGLDKTLPRTGDRARKGSTCGHAYASQRCTRSIAGIAGSDHHPSSTLADEHALSQ
jgi:hypothetical protein